MHRLYLAVLLVFPLRATTITDVSPATDLAGATVTVTRFGGVMSSATFVLGPGGSAVATSPGSAGFELTVSPGDTSFSTWTLVNTDPSAIIFNRITAVSIDLTLSGRALFDNGSAPSSAGSLSGVLGVVPTGGVGIVSSGEVNPWSDGLNAGDMFTAVSIGFGGGFTAGASATWTDDTDTFFIPEPASGWLTLAGALALGTGYCRRRTAIK